MNIDDAIKETLNTVEHYIGEQNGSVYGFFNQLGDVGKVLNHGESEMVVSMLQTLIYYIKDKYPIGITDIYNNLQEISTELSPEKKEDVEQLLCSLIQPGEQYSTERRGENYSTERRGEQYSTNGRGDMI